MTRENLFHPGDQIAFLDCDLRLRLLLTIGVAVGGVAAGTCVDASGAEDAATESAVDTGSTDVDTADVDCGDDSVVD